MTSTSYTIWVVNHADLDVSNPPAKYKPTPTVAVVPKGTTQIVFRTADGCALTFSKKPSFFGNPSVSGNDTTFTLSGPTPGVYQYKLKCGNNDVDGDSPPIIIIDN